MLNPIRAREGSDKAAGSRGASRRQSSSRPFDHSTPGLPTASRLGRGPSLCRNARKLWDPVHTSSVTAHPPFGAEPGNVSHAG